MKAITICQPYAWLITLPETDPRHKRSENRTWYTSYRGPILIHAGKSRSWLDSWQDITPAELRSLDYGCIVAKAQLIACCRPEAYTVARLATRGHDSRHVVGPWCWVLSNVTPLFPVPINGAQGLWEYHGEIFRKAEL